MRLEQPSYSFWHFSFLHLIFENYSTKSITSKKFKLQELNINAMNRRSFIKAAVGSLLLESLNKKAIAKQFKTTIDDDIKTAILYSNLNSHIPSWRDLDDAIKIVVDLNTDFIWQGMIHGGLYGMPENEDTAYDLYKKAGYSDDEAREIAYWVKRFRWSYESLKEQVDALNKRTDTIFCGGILCQYLNYKLWNEVTGRIYTDSEIEDMMLDLSKWDLPYNREKTQELFRKAIGRGYYGDITNEKYRGLLLSRVKKFSECGVKAFWFDMLYSQAFIIAKYITKNFRHEAVIDSFEAATEFIEKARKYGIAGTWINQLILCDTLKYDAICDFTTADPGPETVLNFKFNEKRWSNFFSIKKNTAPEAKFLITFNWGPRDSTSLAVFSQKLNSQQQCQYLQVLNNFARKNNAIPVFPVHGGYLGPNANKLAWGKYNMYDALAPEFNTYECIKRLTEEAQIGVTPTIPKTRIPEFNITTFILCIVILWLINKIKKKT